MAPYRTDLLFLAVVSVVFILLAAEPNILSHVMDGAPTFASLSPWRIIPLPLWMAGALLAGFGVPLYLLIQRHGPAVGRAALAVIAVFAIQIALEIGARRLGIAYAAPAIGALFTAWRLYQLQRLRREISPEFRISQSLVFTSLIFWSCNLAFLALTFLPRL